MKKRGWKASKSQRLERSAGKCWMSSGYEMAIALLTSLPILLPTRDHASKVINTPAVALTGPVGSKANPRRKRREGEKGT